MKYRLVRKYCNLGMGGIEPEPEIIIESNDIELVKVVKQKEKEKDRKERSIGRDYYIEESKEISMIVWNRYKGE